MSPEERQLLTALFDRIRTAAATPRDRDAEALVDQSTREQPYAAYYLAQAVIVQEKGLEAAAGHIKDLEARVRELEADRSDNDKPEQGGGFLSSIFGNSQPPQPRQPVPQAPSSGPTAGPWGAAPRQQIQQNQGFDTSPRAMPQQQPSGPWNPQASAPSAGGSFLQGALGTAAGVAGGMLLANSLSGIFGNHMSSLGLGSAAGATPASAPTEETVINNYYNNDGDKQQASNDTAKNANDTQQVADNNDNNNDDVGLQQADYDNSDDGFDDQPDFGNDDSFNA